VQGVSWLAIEYSKSKTRILFDGALRSTMLSVSSALCQRDAATFAPGDLVMRTARFEFVVTL